MSSFSATGLTNKGRSLQAKAQAGAELHYTKFVIGDGQLVGQSISALTNVISAKKTIDVTKLKMTPPNQATVGFVLSNQDVTTGFFFREIGLYAMDPDDGEILYYYLNAGDTADYIPAAGGRDVIDKDFDILVYVGQAQSVTAIVDENLVYVTHKELEEAIEGINPEVPDASLTIAGKTMLSNATNGTRENVAATEKAVGLAFQAGNERKAEVVALLVAKGVSATISESWASLITKLTAMVRATGNATLADVLAGKTFSTAAGNAMVGTMTNYSAGYANPSTGTDIYGVDANTTVGRFDFNLPPGYHAKVQLHVLGATRENIRNGAKVGHPTDPTKQLTGSYGWDGTITSAQVLNGYIGYNASGRVVGAMPVASDPTTHWLSSGASYGPYSAGDPNSYIYFDTQGMVGKYNSNISWARFPVGDILPQNFRAGKTAFGGQLVGTLQEGYQASPGGSFVLDSRLNSTSTNSTAPAFIKGFTPPTGGTYRVAFDLAGAGSVGAVTLYGRIYVNGVPRGTQRSQTQYSSISYTEDITINKGEEIQLFLWVSATLGYNNAYSNYLTLAINFPITVR